MYVAIYQSKWGYNPTTRLGKLFIFSCRGMATYMCEVNIDLIDVSFWLRHFINIVRKKVQLNIATRKISLHELFKIKLGIKTFKIVLKEKMNQLGYYWFK